jgi:hypothetical protein
VNVTFPVTSPLKKNSAVRSVGVSLVLQKILVKPVTPLTLSVPMILDAKLLAILPKALPHVVQSTQG